jgi:TonB-dependent receptor
MTSFATRRASFYFFLIFFLPTGAVLAQSNTGRISGQAVDSSNGRGVANVAVTVVGVNLSANTDVSGRYVIEDVPAGTYDVSAEKVDFRPATITGVTVVAGEATALDLPLAPAESVIRMDVMTVSAEVVQNSDIGLLNARHKSAAVSDAIGGDQFGRLAVGDAAEAMSKVTGASIVGGKYVLIRGLGDRYSNTLLNGTAVPSADPDKRAVQMDQFPSDLIDAITTTKSFTPDQPGAFSGGSVNVKTKAFPDQFFATASVTAEYNDNTTGKLILDAPVRGTAAPSLPSTIPGRTAAQLAARQGDFGPAEELDRASKIFASGNLFPGTTKAEPNFGASLAIGNRHLVGEDGLFGYTASFSYERRFSHFENGEANRFIGTPDAPQSRLVLTTDPELLSIAPIDAVTAPPFGVTSSTHTERRGGFAKLALRPVENHELTVDILYNETTDSVIRRGVGEETINYVGSVFEVYDMLHTERTVGSAQLSGKSVFPELNSLEFEWRAAVSTSTQDQPDYRTLAAVYMPDGAFVNATGVQPNRFFRELEEDAKEGGLDLTYPFGEHRLKVGAMAASNERGYREQRFQYSLNPRSRDELEMFPNPVGIVSRTTNSVTFGNTIQRLQEPNSYEGEQDISAAYAMADAQVTPRVRVIGGVRFEKTEMRTDPVPVVGGSPKIGMIDQTDALPALSVVFASSPKTNWRFAYGRTVARPTYKELTDIRYEDVFTGDVYLGNADLELTVIDNFDIRWEWFPRKGETVAVSAFYKRLDQPIEVLYGNAVGAIQPNNVDRGTVRGVELEYRRSLKFLGNAFAEFSVGTNLTFVESEVTIPAAELAILRAYDPQADDKRELLGQSPYIFNFDISYDRVRSGTGVTLSYNVVGERLDLVNFGPLPDVFEQPAPLLNLVISQRLSDRWRLKFSAKNLLDPDHEKTIGLPDRTLIYARSNAGRSFALGLSCAF